MMIRVATLTEVRCGCMRFRVTTLRQTFDDHQEPEPDVVMAGASDGEWVRVAA